MELTPNSTLSGRERQESLKQWFMDEFGSLSAAASRMGISGKALKELCFKERVPTYRFNQFIDLGAPAGLLPDHGYNKPGPKAAPDSGEAEASSL